MTKNEKRNVAKATLSTVAGIAVRQSVKRVGIAACGTAIGSGPLAPAVAAAALVWGIIDIGFTICDLLDE